MPLHIVWSVNGYPVSAPHRWTHDGGAPGRDRHLGAIFDSLSAFYTNEGHPVNQIPWNAARLCGKCH